jgi:hypothetical protein
VARLSSDGGREPACLLTVAWRRRDVPRYDG